MRVEPVDDRRLLARDEIEAVAGVERFGEHHTGAPDHRHERPLDEAEGVKERQVHEDHVVDGDAHAIAVIPGVPDHAMVVHGALGEAGGPRRVEDEGTLLGIDLAGAPPERVVADTPAALQHLAPADAVRVGPVRKHDDVAEAGEARRRARAQRRHDLAHQGEIVDRSRALGENHGSGV